MHRILVPSFVALFRYFNTFNKVSFSFCKYRVPGMFKFRHSLLIPVIHNILHNKCIIHQLYWMKEAFTLTKGTSILKWFEMQDCCRQHHLILLLEIWQCVWQKAKAFLTAVHIGPSYKWKRWEYGFSTLLVMAILAAFVLRDYPLLNRRHRLGIFIILYPSKKVI